MVRDSPLHGGSLWKRHLCKLPVVGELPPIHRAKSLRIREQSTNEHRKGSNYLPAGSRGALGEGAWSQIKLPFR